MAGYAASRRVKLNSLVALGAALAVTGVLAPLEAIAQVGGANVGGVVTDETGARLAGVAITITNKANGTSHLLITGVEGNYRAVALQPAPYDIVAELAGFAPVRRSLTLAVGADATIDFKLVVATLAESIKVSGEAPAIEVAKSQQSSLIVTEQLQVLPNLGRNFLELAQLMPGSGPDNSRTQYFNPTKFGGVGDQRNGFTTIIDGGDVDDVIWGSTTMNFSQEAMQEFKVFRNQFGAEYGNALAAVVAVVSKSGGNKLAGTGFYFGRDRALNATNAFATTKPPFDQQRYGGSLGGPIVQNKTHFFGAYEFSNLDTAKIIALPPTNPFAAQENGNFPAGASNHLADLTVDHRFNTGHSMSVRYAYDNQKLLRTQNVSSDSNQIDEYSRTHSVVTEETWIASQRLVNTVRFHYLRQNVGNTPHSFDELVSRPSATTGQSSISPESFPRTRKVLSDTLYINAAAHDLEFGGDIAFASTQFASHFNEHGGFTFTTDAAFDGRNPATWPLSFIIGQPGVRGYKSKQIALFAQDTWRVADRVRLNLGVRYDVDTNLRNNDFYASVIDNPAFAGIGRFISKDRGNDFNNLQPRFGATWDVRGDATLVMRGGYGVYVTRNRPWFQLFSMDSLLGNSVTIQDPQLLRFYPDINAVLGGKSLDDYIAAGGARSVFLIPDDSVLPYSLNGTFGIGWQLNPATSLDVDYVHDLGDHQLGGRDFNLPETGSVNVSNPRPVSGFTSVTLMQNFTKTWYDALEMQLRARFRGLDNVLISYTLSRSYRDGVNGFVTLRGTQRTPRERGYNDTDQRHNLTVSMAARLPWSMGLSGIGKFISGSPILAQAGFDMDGDLAVTNDRPESLPTRVGREKVDESLQIINDLRASRGLAAIDRALLGLDVFISIDMRLTKDIRLSGSRRLELFLEGYNLTNHVNYQPFTINTNIISSSFLVRNSARDGRQAQWGARFVF
jgi:outer membrane receptor protein involved in Fe transport